jgi:hypothetical protein
MIISGHMNFFTVTQCGLYRNDSMKEHGLDMPETFKLIADWVAGKSLASTIPWNPEDRMIGTNCYCHDIYKCESTGDYVFVLWKSDVDTKGSMWGAQEDQPTGEGKVVEYTNAYRGKKVIWGRPCYYWIIPSLNTVVSIKFDHSVCDSNLFQEWISASITNRVTHPNKRKEQTEQGYARLHFTDGTQNSSLRFRYGFDMGLISMDSSDGRLKELASKITHVIKRETIALQPKDERAGWVKMFDNVPYLATKNRSVKRQIEIKAEAQPTPKEVEEIIHKFARENRRPNEWDNIGFVAGDQTLWVDRYRLRNTVEYNYTKGVISAVELFERINLNRTNYLSPIVKSSKNGTLRASAKEEANVPKLRRKSRG